MTQIIKKDFGAKILFVFCLGLGLIAILQIFPYQIDDAFITYRYSQNFLLHGVFSFNPTGMNVEGFSSPTWFLIGIFWGYLFGPDSIHWSGVVVGVCSYLGLAVLYKKYLIPDAFLSSIAVSLVLLTPCIIYYSATGLESIFFVLLINIFVFSLLGKINRVCGYVAILIICWTRPESPWLFVMLLSFLVINNKEVYKEYAGYVVAMAIGSLSVLIVRWVIFHEVFPNTYFEKESDIIEGLAYLESALGNPWFLSLFIAATVSVFLQKNRQVTAVYLMGCSWLLVGVIEGGDWMPMFRFFLPAMSLLILSIFVSFESLQKMLDNLTTKIFALIFLLIFIPFSLNAIHQESKLTDNALVMYRQEFLWLKQWLIKNKFSRIAAVDIGELGYSTNFEILDLGGLTDGYIAKLSGPHLGKEIPIEYLLHQNPQIVFIRLNQKPVNTNLQIQDVITPAEKSIASAAEFIKYYALGFVVSPVYVRQYYYGNLVFINKAEDISGLVNRAPIVRENGIPFVYFNMHMTE